MMAGNERYPTRRIHSSPFSRLLPTAADPLDSYGLPSKGETRLNDFKAQESYHAKIVERYMKFCADSGSSHELERQFAAVSLAPGQPSALAAKAKEQSQGLNATERQKSSDHARKLQKGPTSSTDDAKGYPLPAATLSSNSNRPAHSTELSTILHAMRKLRESIIATSRVDAFAQRAYIFIVRSSILVRHYESYHPALLYLLYSVHPSAPLSSPELREFVGYHILDLACRQNDLKAAYAMRYRYALERDWKIAQVLHALVHDDWTRFWAVRRAVDGHQRAIVEWAVDDMRMHALKCLGRSYMTAEKAFVERSADMEWEELVQRCNVGWELDGEKVTIRRPKTK